MKSFIKRTAWMVAGLCWLTFALVFALFFWQYLTENAGLIIFNSGISPINNLIALVHIVGLIMATVICFVLGLGFGAYGLVAHERSAVPDVAKCKVY